MSLIITDLSHYNDVQNISQALEKVNGVIHKASQGENEDPAFQVRMGLISGFDTLRGAYHFFDPNTDPRAQADTFFKVVKPFLPMFLGLDLEAGNAELTGGGWAKQGTDANMKNVLAFLSQLELLVTGLPGIYSYAYFMKTYLPGLDLSAWPLWLTAPATSNPKMPDFWKDWTIWQYDCEGIIQGIRGDVDLSIFKGEKADFQALYCKSR